MTANTFTWVGTSGGDWNTGTLWSPAGPPDASSVAIIGTASPGAYTVTVSASDTITVGKVTLQTGNATLETDGTLDSTGLVTVTAGTLTVLNSGTVELGNGMFLEGATVGSAAMIVSGTGAVALSASGINDGFGANGQLTVNSGGNLQVTGGVGLGVGQNSGGNGTVDVESGGTLLVTVGQVAIGVSASTGTVTVDGANSLLQLGTNTTGLRVGVLGSGKLDVMNGGTVAIAGGTQVIGSSGTGVLAISGGTLINSSGSLLIAAGGTAAGTVVVDGANALLKLGAGSTGMIVGDGGTGGGTLDVTNGATVAIASGGLIVGDFGVGVVAVNGGTLIDSSGGLTVGMGPAAASLTVQNGSIIATGQLVIGGGGSVIVNVGTGGTLTANGTGASFFAVNSGASITVDDGLFSTTGTLLNFGQVGSSGPSMLVENAGTFSSGAGTDGVAAIARGMITVTGTNSLWDATGAIKFGNSSAGTLAVASGAMVNTHTNAVFLDQGSSINVAGAGAELIAGGLTIASQSGSGTLSVGSGGTVALGAGGMVIGGATGLQGAVAVNGGTLTETGGVFTVANSGAVGSLTVQNGSVIDTGGLTIGNGGTAIVTVGTGGVFTATGSGGVFGIGNGAGGGPTTLTIDDGMFSASGANMLSIGGSANVSMLVENAGTVVTSAFFGTSIGGTGTNVANVTVTGPNSIWHEAGILTVGGGGAGTLAVTGGGMVNAGQSQILIGNVGFGTNIASGTVTVDGVGSELAGGKLVLAQATASAGSLTVSNGGLLSVNSLAEGAGGGISMAGGTLSAGTDVSPILGSIHGFGTLAATLGNGGVITASSGRLFVTGSIQSAGVSNIDGGATLEVGLGISANQAVNFVTPGNGDFPSELFLIPEVLQLDHLTATENFTLSNWRDGDELVVGDGSTVTGAQWLNGSALSGTLQVVTTGGTYNFTNVNLAVGAFPIFSIVGGNTVELVSCFAAGARIATERGEVNVEDLREGDRVQLALDDQAEPIIWIGHRTVECWRHPKPTQVWPVRISADAFGPGRPYRDLWLSPDHAVYVEGVLIPVKHLINDTTIRQVPVHAVTYYHVELPQHAVLLAEGLPAESYLDVGDRTQFANGDGPIALHADFASRRWEAEGCAPLVVTGPTLEAARRLASVDGGDAERTAAVA